MAQLLKKEQQVYLLKIVSGDLSNALESIDKSVKTAPLTDQRWANLGRFASYSHAAMRRLGLTDLKVLVDSPTWFIELLESTEIVLMFGHNEDKLKPARTRIMKVQSQIAGTITKLEKA